MTKSETAGSSVTWASDMVLKSYNVEQIAKSLDKSEKFVRQEIESLKLVAFRAGRDLRISAEALRNYQIANKYSGAIKTGFAVTENYTSDPETN